MVARESLGAPARSPGFDSARARGRASIIPRSHFRSADRLGPAWESRAVGSPRAIAVSEGAEVSRPQGKVRRKVRCAFVLGAFVAAGVARGEVPSSRVIGAALVEGRAYGTLAELTDGIGPRLSGSPQLERAIAWAVATLERAGADRVWTETVRVPRWVRGREEAWLVAPAAHQLVVTALGGSDPTPAEGIEAEVVEVAAFEELEALGEAGVRGKLVLYNRKIEREGGRERGYGSAVELRTRGAIQAGRLGAVGALVRSLGTADYRLPHTGAMLYEDGVPRIPAAAVTAEDAELIHRFLASGARVRVRLLLGCRNEGEVESANVLAELRGREKEAEIVLIGAHLDSWDLGTGALDDGAGVAVVIETVRLLAGLGERPRRTVRAVLFTNEENGLRGGLDYARRHADELGNHVAAIESDSGAGAPLGFRVSAGPGGADRLRELMRPLAVLGSGQVAEPGGGADIGPLRQAGVPLIGLWQDTTYYFDYHHTAADTLDKVDPDELAKNLAALAWLTYALAEYDPPLARLP